MHSICKFNLCSTHSKWKMTIHCIGIPEPASDCESLLSSDLEFELQVASESESLLRISELFWKHSGVLYSHSCWLLSMALTWLCDVSWKSMHIVYKCNYTCYIYVIIIILYTYFRNCNCINLKYIQVSKSDTCVQGS